jgi:hypothetical protein
MIQEFNIFHVPEADFHIFFTVYMEKSSGRILETAFVVPSPGSGGYQANLEEDRKLFIGVCEWKGRTAHVYFRLITGGRGEFIIPDTENVYNMITYRQYDSSNKLFNTIELKSFQMSGGTGLYLEVEKGVTIQEVIEKDRGNSKTEVAVGYLRKVGTPENVIPEVINSIEWYELTEKQMLTAYMKGEMSFDEYKVRMTHVRTKHYNDFTRLSGVDRYNRYVALVHSHPLWKFRFDSGADVRKLADEMVDRTLP